MESLVESYKQIKCILISRRQQAKFNKIYEYVLKQLISLPKLFKYILQLVQTGSGPSLYMVLPCTLSLRKALSSFDELMKYQASKTPDNKQLDDGKDTDEDCELLVESRGEL